MRLVALVVGLAILVLLPFLIWGESFELMFSQQGSVQWLRDAGKSAVFLALALLIFDVFLPIPATAVLAALGIVYGPVIGGLIGSVGTFLSGVLAYSICRLLGQRAAHALLGETDHQRSQALFAKFGVWVVMLSRWLPIVPEVVACMAGLSRMRTGSFLAALACGCIPMAFAFALAGHLGADSPVITMVVCALAPLLLWAVAQSLSRSL